MQLSRLEIHGFKSFAQRTTVQFDPGITAVVGPNGCGKSNIVDAIRWVLGEQRAAALRSENMGNVLFNGTRKRKPLGMAEVSLTVENTRNVLPTAYTEVTITRRLFRSGESDYLLNRVPCRLKDILDLFMDTGMGADAYSVIELKMIETILSDRADERRRLFEEAAGVTKYKARRKAALRKLETTKTDLVRLDDIVGEIEKAVSSLARQARKAEKAAELGTEIRRLELLTAVAERDRLVREIGPLVERLLAIEAERETSSAAIRTGEAELERAQTALIGVEAELSGRQRALDEAVGALHRLEENRLVRAERKRSLTGQRDRFADEMAQIADQTAARTAELAVLVEQVAAAVARHDQARTGAEQARESATEGDQSLARSRTALEAARRRAAEALRSVNETEGQRSRLLIRRDGLRQRLDRIEADQVAAEDAGFDAETRVEQLTVELDERTKALAEARTQLETMVARRDELRAERDGVRDALRDVTGRLDGLIRRRDFLRGLIERAEGLPEGVQRLVKERHPAAANGTLGDRLDTADAYRPALAALLGELSAALPVESVEIAHDAIARLRETNSGKVTFLPPGDGPFDGRPTRMATDGLVGWALDLLTGSPPEAALTLLADAVVVTDLAAAERLVEAHPDLRAVTLDGQLVGRGMLRGGSARRDEGQAIGRREQLARLDDEIAAAETERGASSARSDEIALALTGLAVEPAQAALRTVERVAVEAERRLDQAGFEHDAAVRSTERLTAEQTAVEAELRTISGAADELLPELDERAYEQKTADATLATLIAASAADETAQRARLDRSAEATLVAVRAEAEVARLRTERERTESILRSLAATAERRAREAASADGEIARLETDLARTETEVIAAVRLRDEKQAALARAEQTAVESRNAIHRTESALRDERRRHDTALALGHELSLARQERSVRLETLRIGVRTEHGVLLDELPTGEPAPPEADRTLAALRESLRTLGPVNALALAEYETERTRLDFLTSQRADVLAAERTLLETIKEINDTAQRRFRETFALIRENFQRTFRTLFDPGDEADITLEADRDPLEATVEIIARPRGKRPQSISLLSGGEKTLTAIALLFAIYLVKPSPFCILDEVDAPLDDANVDRFTRILHEFSAQTQFIVVTHNKRTMASARTLYGVTMDEPGVSKLVPVRFD